VAKGKVSREERMSEIQDKLLSGIKEIYESGKWAEYISVMSKFPNYSINNCILIASQCPQASYVCGYKKWEEFNRNVVKGSTGIMIIAPVKKKVDVEEPKYDANHHPVLNADGTQASEMVTKEFNSFRPCYVFDLSQTEGEPLPSLVHRLEESVEEFEQLKNALIAISPVPISFEEVPGEANGFFSPSEMRIVIQEGMPELQTIKTMVHEIAHATLGHGSKEDKWDRETHEVQAESICYWTLQMLNGPEGKLDTSDYSFGYIAGWSKDKEISELKENLELIKNTANDLVQRIDAELLKQTQSEEEQLAAILEESKSVPARRKTR